MVTKLSTEGKSSIQRAPEIHLLAIPLHKGSWRCQRLSLMRLGKKQATPLTCRQSITGQTRRDKRPLTFTPMANLRVISSLAAHLLHMMKQICDLWILWLYFTHFNYGTQHTFLSFSCISISRTVYILYIACIPSFVQYNGNQSCLAAMTEIVILFSQKKKKEKSRFSGMIIKNITIRPQDHKYYSIISTVLDRQ